MTDSDRFPKIHAFHHVVKFVREVTPNQAPVTYRGTVKLHGTNAGVVMDAEGNLTPQSRNRTLTLEVDNAGFASFVAKNEGIIQETMTTLAKFYCEDGAPLKSLTLFGEWCGPGIQKHVAINKLPHRMWVLFGFKAIYPDGTETFVDFSDGVLSKPFSINPDIHFIHFAPAIDLHVDLRDDLSCNLAKDKINAATVEVEKQCPFAKLFGIEGTGEGIVWKPVGPDHNNTDLWFKSKGGEHQGGSALKIAAGLTAPQHEGVAEFVSKVVCDERVSQGVARMLELHGRATLAQTKDFLVWIEGDIQEEHSDELEASGISWANVKKSLSNRAVAMWKKAIEEV